MSSSWGLQVLKERYRRSLTNAAKDQPLTHADREVDSALTNENFPYPRRAWHSDAFDMYDLS